MNFTLKIINDGTAEMIQRHQARSKRRFLNRLRTISWENGSLKVYLRVNYGKHEDVFGKKTALYNDGWYKNEKDLLFAFKAFTEEGL